MPPATGDLPAGLSTRLLLSALLLLSSAAAVVASRYGYNGDVKDTGGYGYAGTEPCKGRHSCGSYGGGSYGGGSYGGGPTRPPGYYYSAGRPVNPDAPTDDDSFVGAQWIELELGYTTFDVETYQAGLPAFMTGLADLLRVPDNWISASVGAGVSAGSRRFLLSEDAPWAALVSIEIQTVDAAWTAELLTAADRDGTLAALLRLLGGELGAMWWTALAADGTPISSGTLRSVKPPNVPTETVLPPAVPDLTAQDLPPMEGVPTNLEPTGWVEAPAAAPAEAPAASPVSAATASIGEPASNKKKSKNGAIIGGVIGGVVGGVALGAVLLYVAKRRNGADGGQGAFTVTNPTFGQAGVTATLTTAAGKGQGSGRFTLEEIVEATGTPRSARRRMKTPFNGGDAAAGEAGGEGQAAS